jgi:hypothetical protein
MVVRKMQDKTESSLFERINDYVSNNYFNTLLIQFSAVIFCYYTTQEHLGDLFKFAMPWVLLLLITAKSKQHQFAFLLICTVMLGANVAMKFFEIANHGFMIVYIALALLIACAAEDRNKAMSRMSLLILTILMGGALLQKLASPYYMSGNLIGELIMRGEVYQRAISLVYPEWIDQVAQNQALLTGGMANASFALDTVRPFVMPTGIAVVAMVLTYISLATQLGVELALIFRARLGVWAHYILMLFVVIIYSSRNENTFLSMNCILGYAMTDEDTKAARIGYVLLLFFLLTSKLLGTRPDLFR